MRKAKRAAVTMLSTLLTFSNTLGQVAFAAPEINSNETKVSDVNASDSEGNEELDGNHENSAAGDLKTDITEEAETEKESEADEKIEASEETEAETEEAKAETEEAKAETEEAKAETEEAKAETEEAEAETEEAKTETEETKSEETKEIPAQETPAEEGTKATPAQAVKAPLANALPPQMALAALAPLKAGDVFELDGIQYKVLSENTVQVGNGTSLAISEDDTMIMVPETIEHDGVDYTVVALGDKAFTSSTLTQVALPDSIERIGKRAFAKAPITEIELPSSVKELGEDAFLYCDALTSVTLGGNLEKIPDETFKGLGELSSVTLREGIKEIGKSAFSGCNSLASMDLPESITSIGDEAFYDTGLTSIVLPADLEVIGSSSFKDCRSLTDVSFLNNSKVTEIKSKAFSGTKLKAIELPASLKTFAEDAFYNCSSLSEINVADGSNDFKSIDGVLLRDSVLVKFPENKSIDTYEVPQEVESIANNAFEATKKLLKVIVPDTVTAIGTKVFKDSSVTEVTMEDGVQTIGTMAFYNCNSLKKVSLSNQISVLPEYLFYNCSNLEEVNIPAAVTQVGTNTFQNVSSDIIYTVTSEEMKAILMNNGVDGAQITVSPLAPVTAKEFTVDNITYTVIKAPSGTDNGTVQVGNGEKAISYTASDLHIPATVTYDGDRYTVEAIGKRAFMDNTSIKTVTIEAGVSEIGENAFTRSSLRSVVIPNSVDTIKRGAFSACESLSQINLPDSLTEIPESMLSSCDALTSVTIPEGVVKIGVNAFNQCASLKSVSLPSTLEVIDTGAFWSIDALTTVTLAPDSKLETIGARAFQYCSVLKAMELPATLKNIEEYAFDSCSKLAVSFPDGNSLVRVGEKAFIKTSIKTFDIPATLTDFDVTALNDCSKLTSINVAEENTQFRSKDGVLYNKAGTILYKYPISKNQSVFTTPKEVTSIADNAFSGVTGLQTLNVADGVTEIGAFAFSYASGVRAIHISGSVKTIGKLAFYNCEELSDVTLPEGLEAVEQNLFFNCPKLTGIVIPKNVKTIGADAFSRCSELIRIVIVSDVLESVAPSAFGGVSEDAVFQVASEPIKTLLVGSGIDAGKITVDASLPTEEVKEFTVGDFRYGVTGAQTAALLDATRASGAVLVPEAVRFGGKEYTVTSIGDRAFLDALGVTSITLPETVTEIGEQAIFGCENLLSVHLPASLESVGVTGVSSNRRLKEISIASGSRLKELDNGAFSDNMALEELTIPASVTTMGTHTMAWNYGLKHVTFEAGSALTQINEGTFFRDKDLLHVTLPLGINGIEDEAFYNCTSLEAIDLQNVDEIGERAFYGCESIKDIVLSNGLEELKDGTFYNAKSLERIVIGENVTQIGELISAGEDGITGVFEGASGLKNIILPASVSSIGKNAFKGAASLNIIELDMENLDALGVNAFLDIDENAKFYVKNASMKALLTESGEAEEHVIVSDQVRADKSDLLSAIQLASEYNKADYTESSYKAMQEALKKAQEVANEARVSQTKVDQAESTLLGAIGALVKNVSESQTDKSHLLKVISLASGYSKADYTDASYQAMEDARNKAQAVANDAKASQQSINEAAGRLSAAIKALVKKSKGSSGNGSGGSGSSGSGSSGSGGSSTTASNAQGTGTGSGVTYAPLDHVSAQAAVMSAVAALPDKKAPSVSVDIKNIGAISLDTFRAMVRACGDKAIQLNVSSVIADTNQVDVRISLDAAKVTKDLNLSASTVSSEAVKVKETLSQKFSNQFSVLSLGQKGDFGTPVEIMVKPALTSFDINNLVFYSYDKQTGLYTLITEPKCTLDQEGYIHFTTSLGGEIIVSDNYLTFK